MSRLDDFLSHNIEGYLFKDLRMMERDDPDGNGVGYPLLMSACAGIELLGALLSSTRFDTWNHGHVYFGEYWRDVLYASPSPHSSYGAPVYQLVRHGIAHAFFPKGEIGVLRNDSSRHFGRDSNGLLLIDAVQLARDLVTSYENRVKPHLAAATPNAVRTNMEAQLTEMERVYHNQASTHGAPLAAAPLLGATGPVTRSLAPSISNPSLAGPSGPLPVT